MLRSFLASTVLAFVASNTRVYAEEVVDPTRTAARHLALEGSDLFAAEDYEAARDRFRRAYDVYAAPTLASWHARALQALGRWGEAEEWYILAAGWKLDAEASPAFRSAIQEAEVALQTLRAQMPKVRLVMQGSLGQNSRVTLDDREIPGSLIGVHQPVDPGPHRAEVWIDGQLVSRVDVTVGVAEQRDVMLDVSLTRPEKPASGAAPPPPLDPVVSTSNVPADTEQGTVAWRWPVVGGLGTVGVLGLTFGVWQGAKAASQYRELKDELCDDNVCPADKLDAFRQARARSTMGYAIGAGALVGGAACYWLSSGSDDDTHSAGVTPWLGWRSAGVTGRF